MTVGLSTSINRLNRLFATGYKNKVSVLPRAWLKDYVVKYLTSKRDIQFKASAVLKAKYKLDLMYLFSTII